MPEDDDRVTMGRLLAAVGGGIAVSVAACWGMILLHSENESAARAQLEKTMTEVKEVVRDGLHELRSDVKEILKGPK